jgi:hypothetical protein
MRLRYLALLLPLGGSLLAQTQIGGGSCNSSSLTGAYTFTLSGRQVAASGAFTGVFQANGTATFDGTNKITLTMTAATIQSPGTPLIYSGTYSVQSNCAGAINITTGDTATFNLLIYNQGKAFLMSGTDASYTYSGGGGTQPANCATNLLSGAYVFEATGFTLASGAINGAVNAGGLMQLDGHSTLTVTLSYVAQGQNPLSLTLNGTYVVPNGCSGTGTMKDGLGNTYTLAFTVSGGSAVSTATFDVVLGQANQLLFTGTAHAAYGQPAATARVNRTGVRTRGAE